MPHNSRQYFKASKTLLSNWLLAGFLLTLGLAAAFSEFFQAPDRQAQELLHYRHVFSDRVLASGTKIELINELGTFRLQRRTDASPPGWELVFPRKLSANAQTVRQIFNAIRDVKILKIYPKDPINMANYSLNEPLMSVTLEHSQDQSTRFEMGLINPIDNSTYVTLSHKDTIFHVEKLKFPIRTLSLSDLIDTTIFSVPTKDIAEFKIYKGQQQTLTFSIKHQGGNWFGRDNKILNNKKITRYLEKVSDIRSLFILDKMSSKLEKEIERRTAPPLYTVILKDKKGTTYTYSLSRVLPKLSGIKMEKWQNFLITASHRRHPYLVSKSHLKIFVFSESQINRLSLKRLFY